MEKMKSIICNKWKEVELGFSFIVVKIDSENKITVN